MEMPTLAFVPGFMQRCGAWATVADRLAQRYPSALHERADEHVQPGVVPIGYSMGGRIVLHRALEEPQRWPALVLVGVSAGVGDSAARRAADEELAAWIERHPIEEVVERWEAQPVFATQSKELVDMLRNFGQGAMPPVWDRLPELELPVLLMAGALDDRYVAAGERMATLLPNGTFSAIPDAGHAPQLEQPDAVAAELSAFLDERL